MISVKLKFRTSAVEGKRGSLYYQVIYKGIIRQIATQYRISPEEWNAELGVLKIKDEEDSRCDFLRVMQKRIQWDKKRLMKIIDKYLNSGYVITADAIVEAFYEEVKDITFCNYTQKLIANFQKNGQMRTSETYNSALNSFMRFNSGQDLYFVEFDSDLIVSYEYYLKNENLSMNTISFYMRRLRAIYNRAVEDGLAEQNQPFRKVFTSTERTIKRAIPLQYIKRLKSLDLSHSMAKTFARDMFFFSFYTRGMSFVDIAYLQKKDLKNGILTYRRKKTRQQLSVHWEPCMQEIVDRYCSDFNSPYIFNVIKSVEKDARKQYLAASTLINRNLKELGKQLGLDKNISMYAARHSWASIAKNEGISLSVISECMGHDSEKTTQIYLASLDSSIIDNANQQIIKLI